MVRIEEDLERAQQLQGSHWARDPGAGAGQLGRRFLFFVSSVFCFFPRVFFCWFLFFPAPPCGCGSQKIRGGSFWFHLARCHFGTFLVTAMRERGGLRGSGS